jgi:hypothetical protein
MRSASGSHNGSLDGNPQAMAWQQQQQQLRQKSAEELLNQHQQQQQQQRAMPLSPPLTPLPPRFMAPVPPPHLLPHSPPFAAAANILLAAQQYNPFLARGAGVPAGLPHPLPPPVPMEVLENLHRLLQLRQAELSGGLGLRAAQKPETEELVRYVSLCLNR